MYNYYCFIDEVIEILRRDSIEIIYVGNGRRLCDYRVCGFFYIS